MPPPPRDGGPEVDEVVGADRPLPEPEQDLELDDRERAAVASDQQREHGRNTRPQPGPAVRSTSNSTAGTHFIHVASRPEQAADRGSAELGTPQQTASGSRLMLPVSRLAADREGQDRHEDRGRQRPPGVRPVGSSRGAARIVAPAPDEPRDVPRQQRPRREQRQHPRGVDVRQERAESGGTDRRRSSQIRTAAQYARASAPAGSPRAHMPAMARANTTASSTIAAIRRDRGSGRSRAAARGG